MEILLFAVLNVSVFITSFYLIQKVTHALYDKQYRFVAVIQPLLLGLLSMLMVLLPIDGGMQYDLRHIPLFLSSYIGGWKAGIISLMFSLSLHLSISESIFLTEMLVLHILAVVIGAMLRDRRMHLIISPVRYIHVLGVYFIFECLALITEQFSQIPILPNLQNKAIFIATSCLSLLAIVALLNDTNKQYLLRQRLQHLSNHDPMTDLPNLRYFKIEAKTVLMQDPLVYIAMIDIDFFKQYNDTYGHPAGDEVIRSVGRLLRRYTTEEDIVARYGGEEFIILFRGRNDSVEVLETVHLMREAVEKCPFHGRETQPNQKITISVGISSPSLNKKINHLIEEADIALYQAKSQGRNQIIMFDQVS